MALNENESHFEPYFAVLAAVIEVSQVLKNSLLMNLVQVILTFDALKFALEIEDVAAKSLKKVMELEMTFDCFHLFHP